MCRNTTVCCGRLLALFFLWFSPCVLAQSTAEPAHNEVVIKNAIVMTVTHGNLKNASVYVKDGKIAAVGETVNAPASATVIDAGTDVGKFAMNKFASAARKLRTRFPSHPPEAIPVNLPGDPRLTDSALIAYIGP